MKITFDKVEIRSIGKYHSEAERKFEIPLNHHLEKGEVLQVGSEVTEIKKGDVVLFLSVSKSPVKGNISYLRSREVLFILEEKEGEDVITTLIDDVRAEDTNEDDSLDSGIILPQGVSTGVLKTAKVLNINPRKNSLGLEVGQKIKYHPMMSERRFQFDGTLLLKEHQIIYV